MPCCPSAPLHAHAAKDNYTSVRVLEKCGFEVVGESSDFADGQGTETQELLLMLRQSAHRNLG